MTKKLCPRFHTYKYVRYVSYNYAPSQDELDCIYNKLSIDQSCPLDVEIGHDKQYKTFCLRSNTLEDINDAASTIKQEIENYENQH